MHIKVDTKLLSHIQKLLKNHKWLNYDGVEEFCLDAIKQRVERLLSL